MNLDQRLQEQKKLQKARHAAKQKQIADAQARRACIIRPGNPKRGIPAIIDQKKWAEYQKQKNVAPAPTPQPGGMRMYGGLAKPRKVSGKPENKTPVRTMDEIRKNFNK